MSQFLPFIIILIIALIVNYIPMDELLKKICNIVIGVIVLIMVLQLARIF